MYFTLYYDTLLTNQLVDGICYTYIGNHSITSATQCKIQAQKKPIEELIDGLLLGTWRFNSLLSVKMCISYGSTG